jgi:outer membrane immunogenic protein
MLRHALLATASLAALVITSSAFAADLPARPAYRPAPMMDNYNWTGWYVGAHVGAGQQTSDSTVDVPILAITGASLANISGSGMIGGVQAGYNYQMGWAVVGIEGAFSGSGIRAQGPCFGAAAKCTFESNWFGSISGRFGGLVTDRFLAYVKGGAVWKDTDYTVVVPATGITAISDTRFGYLFGIGGEYKFTQQWSGFTEYNYMDFGRENYAATLGPVAATGHIKDTVHVLKAGINYKFF